MIDKLLPSQHPTYGTAQFDTVAERIAYCLDRVQEAESQRAYGRALEWQGEAYQHVPALLAHSDAQAARIAELEAALLSLPDVDDPVYQFARENPLTANDLGLPDFLTAVTLGRRAALEGGGE